MKRIMLYRNTYSWDMKYLYCVLLREWNISPSIVVIHVTWNLKCDSTIIFMTYYSNTPQQPTKAFLFNRKVPNSIHVLAIGAYLKILPYSGVHMG